MRLKSCVIQDHKFGCGVACLATVLQKTYLEVEQHFEVDLNKTGITNKQEFAYLVNEGLDTALLQQSSWFDRLTNNKRISRPFADIHIISVQFFVDRKMQHAVVMDSTGKIFCPFNGKELKLDKVYLVIDNLGIWYPKNWKFKKEKKKR